MASIHIAKNITAIAPNSYTNSSSTQLTFEEPSTLKTIGNSAFQNAEIANTVIFPNSVESLGLNCFRSSKIKGIVFGMDSKLTAIGNTCFRECAEVEAITLPPSLKYVSGMESFNRCYNLKRVTFHSNIEFGGKRNFTTPETGEPLTVYLDTDATEEHYRKFFANDEGMSEAAQSEIQYINLAPVYSNICFTGEAMVQTDQGPIRIDSIIPDYHTISGKSVVALTETKSNESNLVKIQKDALGDEYPNQTTIISNNHNILFKGKMLPAIAFCGLVPTITTVSYEDETLFNIVLSVYDTMVVNGMTVETLHRTNPVVDTLIQNQNE